MNIRSKLRHDKLKGNSKEVIIPFMAEKEEKKNDMKVDLRSPDISCIDSPRLKQVFINHA